MPAGSFEITWFWTGFFFLFYVKDSPEAMCPPVGHPDFVHALGVGDPRECRGDVAFVPPLGFREGGGELAISNILIFCLGIPGMQGWRSISLFFGPLRR